MREQLLNLLEKAIENNQFAICKLLLDSLLELEICERTVYYPEFTDIQASDKTYDAYEFIIYNN